jgi:hypothetical protein
MTATEHAQLRAEALRLPEGPHREKILEQLDSWGPQFNEPASTARLANDMGQAQDPFSVRRSLGTGSLLPSGSGQLAQTPVSFAPIQSPEPAAPRPPSEQECRERLALGDPDVLDLMVNAYGWERHTITRKLVVLLPRGNERGFVIPVERGFVMGAFDETLATILFDHVPGQLRYVCERPCMVDTTGFEVERLKDADFWRSRELTRGTLV